MALVVQKYGGTSVADAERIKPSRGASSQAAEAGNEVCVVVSAMGDTTDELLELAGQVSQRAARRELDMLLTAGERISMALAVHGDHRPRAPRRSRSPARRPGSSPTRATARRRSSRCGRDRVREALGAGKIAIVAGFQGVSTDDEVTTLGRGGSDTTAVALAAALGADVCEIYTDVEGVYTADPRIVPERAQAARRCRTRRCSSWPRRAPRC